MTEPYIYDEEQEETFKDDRYLTIDGKDFDVHNLEPDEIETAYQADMILIHCENKLLYLDEQLKDKPGPDNTGDSAVRDYEDWAFRIKRARLHTNNHIRILRRIVKEREKNE